MLLSFLCILFWCQAVVTIPFMKSKQTEKSLRHPCFFCFLLLKTLFISLSILKLWNSIVLSLIGVYTVSDTYTIQVCTNMYLDWLMTVIWFHLSTQSYLHQQLVHPHGECAWIFFFITISHFYWVFWIPWNFVSSYDVLWDPKIYPSYPPNLVNTLLCFIVWINKLVT